MNRFAELPVPGVGNALLDSRQVAARLNVSLRQASTLMREMCPINVGTAGSKSCCA